VLALACCAWTSAAAQGDAGAVPPAPSPATVDAAAPRTARPEPVRAEVFVGSEAERYLRVLQLAGRAPVYPWSVRGLGPRDLDHAAPAADAVHPWADALDYGRAAGARVTLVGPAVAGSYNSGFAYGRNDGPVWAGRGFTGAAAGGIALQAGPLSLVLAPTVFMAQNRGFALMPNGRPDSTERFMDPRAPYQIDLPQRFGDGAYRRLDPGESTVRLDVGPLAAGASTASQQWGPAVEQPLVLGNNAGGYPHLFAGTSHAVNVGIGRLQARAVWGTLAQSPYSRVTGRASRRFMSGWAASFSPRPAPNLEVGIGRFYHTPWPVGGLRVRHFTKPFQAFLKSSVDSTGYGPDGFGDPDNQLASVYARWVFPRPGFEVYGEFMRDDHNWDLQDFLLQPDHQSAYTLGLQKLWRRGEDRFLVMRGEVMNARRPNLTQVRTELITYMHYATPQGHTLRGQILGAPDAYGGSAGSLALDAYGPRGRWTVRWDRAARNERAAGDTLNPPALHAQTSLGVERVLFLPAAELTAGARAVWDLNRNFGGDAFNANLTLGVRARL
jgi:hypothetical protein